MGISVDQTKPRPSSLRTLLKDFSAKTTAHGVHQILTAENFIWRTIWTLACMASFGMLLYQAFTLVITYMNKPVKTSIDVYYSQSISFPMVTICNLNIVKRSKMRQFPELEQLFGKYKVQAESNNTVSATSLGMDEDKKKLMKGKLSIKGGHENILSDVKMNAAELVQDEILSILSRESRATLTKAGHSFDEMVFRCSWVGFNCDEGDFLKYWRQTWNWRYGNCFTFNAGADINGSFMPPLTISKPGPMFGLTLDLFIDQEEYIGVLSQEAGVKVLLTDQNQIPFPFTDGFTVSPGLSASVGVRKGGEKCNFYGPCDYSMTELEFRVFEERPGEYLAALLQCFLYFQFVINRIDPFHNGSCYNQDSLEENSIYRSIMGATYSVQGCMNSCLANKQRMMCNCTEGKYQINDSGNVCFSNTQVACFVDVVKAYENGTLGCSRECPQPCSHQSYRTTISSSQWSESYEKDFMRLIMKSKRGFPAKMHSDTSMMRQNFLRLKIFFDELNLERINYSESYVIESLLGDIGGQLGLWVGISALTCCEIIKLFLDMFYYLWRKCLHKRDEKIGISANHIALS